MSRYPPKLSKQALAVKKCMSFKAQTPQSYRGLTLKQYFELEPLGQDLQQIEQESQSELQNELKINNQIIEKYTYKKTHRMSKQSICVKNKLPGQNTHRLQLKKHVINESMTQRQEPVKKNEVKLPSIITHSISPPVNSQTNSQKQHKQSLNAHKRIKTEVNNQKASLSSILPQIKQYESLKVVDKLAMASSKSNQSLKLNLKSTIQTEIKSEFFLTFSKLKVDQTSTTPTFNSNIKMRHI